jgi:hypothetical protein
MGVEIVVSSGRGFPKTVVLPALPAAGDYLLDPADRLWRVEHVIHKMGKDNPFIHVVAVGRAEGGLLDVGFENLTFPEDHGYAVGPRGAVVAAAGTGDGQAVAPAAGATASPKSARHDVDIG